MYTRSSDYYYLILNTYKLRLDKKNVNIMMKYYSNYNRYVTNEPACSAAFSTMNNTHN